jgi:hypothetical protein
MMLALDDTLIIKAIGLGIVLWLAVIGLWTWSAWARSRKSKYREEDDP